MTTSHQDTIYAISSGSVPSGVAVLRISGSRAHVVLAELCGELPEPRKACLRWIRDRNKIAIDQALILLFSQPHSFTGEDCVEFHVHGGRAVVAAMLRLLSGFDGLRHAEPGEFSRRAFENGKLDLVELEGLADLVSSETEMQRRLAVTQAEGGLSETYDDWARRLTRARALIEAELDFADESDVPGSVSDQVWVDVAQVAGEMAGHIAGAGISEIIRDGFTVVLAGPPNSGKSSLLNYLAKRDVAIVTDVAGTTRDVLSVDLDIGGYAVRILDTAGLRNTEDPVEREGIKRSHKSIREADLVVFLKEADDHAPFPEFHGLQPGASVLNVVTKADLFAKNAHSKDIWISTRDGYGIDSLVERIAELLQERIGGNASAIPLRARHVELLRQCANEIGIALNGTALEFRAENLRRALHFLGKITGSVDVEDLLDVIFSEFCIGK